MMRIVLIVLGSIVGLIVVCVLVLAFLSSRPDAKRMTGVIEVDRPASEVWTWITEPGQLVQWVSWLKEVRTVTPGTPGVGHQTVWVMDDPNMKQILEIPGTVTTWDPPRTLGLHIDMKGFGSGDYTYTLAETNGKTRLEQTGTFEYTNALWSLMSPIVMPEAKRKLNADLAKLKQVAEAAPVLPSDTMPEPADSTTQAAVGAATP